MSLQIPWYSIIALFYTLVACRHIWLSHNLLLSQYYTTEVHAATYEEPIYPPGNGVDWVVVLEVKNMWNHQDNVCWQGVQRNNLFRLLEKIQSRWGTTIVYKLGIITPHTRILSPSTWPSDCGLCFIALYFYWFVYLYGSIFFYIERLYEQTLLKTRNCSLEYAKIIICSKSQFPTNQRVENKKNKKLENLYHLK